MDKTKIEAKRAELARTLDCLTSDELRTLANITATTEEAWRKRGTGPAYVLMGNAFLYPRKAVAAFLEARLHEHRGVSAKSSL